MKTQLYKYLAISAFFMVALTGCSKDQPESPGPQQDVVEDLSSTPREIPLMEKLKPFRGAYYQSSKRAMHLFQITEDGFDYRIYYSRDIAFEKNAKLRNIPLDLHLERCDFPEGVPRLVFKVVPNQNDWDHSWIDGGEFVVDYKQGGAFQTTQNGKFFGMFELYPYEISEDGTPSQLIRVGR